MIIKVLEVILLKLAEYFILILKGIPGVLLLLILLAIGLSWFGFVIIGNGIIENHFMKWVSFVIILGVSIPITDAFQDAHPKIFGTFIVLVFICLVVIAAIIAFLFLGGVLSLLAGLGDAIQHARDYPYH